MNQAASPPPTPSETAVNDAQVRAPLQARLGTQADSRPQDPHLRLRLSLLLLLVVAVVMAPFAYLGGDAIKKLAREDYEKQLHEALAAAGHLLDVHQDTLILATSQLGVGFEGKYLGTFQLHRERQFTGKDYSAPVLTLNNKVLNEDLSFIRHFTEETGGMAATIFARVGNDLQRVATTLQQQDGRFATGTYLAKDHPALAKLLNGEVYEGYARLFDKYYMTRYSPIYDDTGEVVGSLFVGLDLSSSLDALIARLREIKVGANGYLAIGDAHPGPDFGKLLVHPQLAGRNFLRDRHPEVTPVVETFLRLRHGTVEYQWKNDPQAPAETKIAVLDEYPGLSWVIAAIGDQGQIMELARLGENYLLAAVLAVSLTLVVLMNLAINRLIIKPQLRARLDLQRSEEQFRTIFDLTDNWIFWINADKSFRFSSRACADITGHIPADFEHNPGLFLQLIHPDDRKRVEEFFTAALAPAPDGTQSGRIDYRIVDRAGQIKHLHQTNRCIIDEERKLLGLCGAILDLSREKEHESILLRQSRHAVIGEMISNIAHQWRQPINAIGLIAQNMKFDSADGVLTKELIDDYATKIFGLVSHMSGTIDEFRSFFQSGKQMTAFRVADAVDQALGIVAASLEGHGIQVEWQPDPELEGFGYPKELAQVLLNLLGNAKEAIIDQDIAAGKIVITCRRQEDRIILCVADNGGGIDEEALPNIFSANYTTKKNGTGLGLFMSMKIMEHMGGSIRVRNTGGGAEFELDFPINTSGAPAASLSTE
jgi:PAS domain S-box-containing protein